MEKMIAYKKFIIITGITLAAVSALLFFLLQSGNETEPIDFDSMEAQNTVEVENSPPKIDKPEEPAPDIMVDVKGSVKKPGVYKAHPGERVLDLINKAGSFKEKADKNKVNLAQAVTDQMVIFVPEVGEQTADTIQESFPQPGTDVSEIKKVNLNTATEEELQTLTGIGPSKAAAILEYRSQNGGFKNVEELKEISGIGDKTFEKIKDSVLVQ